MVLSQAIVMPFCLEHSCSFKGNVIYLLRFICHENLLPLFCSIPKSKQDYPGHYLVYAEGMLTKGSLVLFTLLTGGDYSDGVQGCGPTTALALVRCGFGDQLLSAFHCLDENAFGQFLVQWRCAIQRELATNSLHFLGRNQPKLATDISDTFPN
jgi:5'-3' exonuclease